MQGVKSLAEYFNSLLWCIPWWSPHDHSKLRWSSFWGVSGWRSATTQYSRTISSKHSSFFALYLSNLSFRCKWDSMWEISLQPETLVHCLFSPPPSQIALLWSPHKSIHLAVHISSVHHLSLVVQHNNVTLCWVLSLTISPPNTT